jgi:O-methyltransferase involved in polyketide biosynthesis
MDRALSSFFAENSTGTNCQVVVLGAGKDTTYFRYRNRNIMGMEQKPKCVLWVEVDHTSVVQEKEQLIRQSNLLSSFCQQLVKTEDGFQWSHHDNVSTSSDVAGSTYRLVGHDLRDSPTLLLGKLNLNPSLPTLFLMECVSMYVPIAASKNLLRSLSTCADNAVIVCYEPILGNATNDPFGRMMEQNLMHAGVADESSCLLRTRTLQDHLTKFIEAGFYRAVGCDLWQAYETVLSPEQRRRANQSEFLDEYEEWVLIMQHYCFVAAATCHPRAYSLTKVQGRDTNSEPSRLGFVSGKCVFAERAEPS